MTTLYNQFFLVFTHVDLKVAILKDLIQTKLCNKRWPLWWQQGSKGKLLKPFCQKRFVFKQNTSEPKVSPPCHDYNK